MNPRFARLLTRIYPRSWRERYGAEFEELLETGRGGFHTVANVAWSGLRERIFPIHSKVIDKVDLLRSSKVRRAKLYYLRGLKGKAARLRDVERPS